MNSKIAAEEAFQACITDKCQQVKEKYETGSKKYIAIVGGLMAALLVPALIFLIVRGKKKAQQEAKEQEEMLAQQEDIITNLMEKYGINDDEESRRILSTLQSRSLFDARRLPRLTKPLLRAMAEIYYTKKNITDNDLELFIEHLSAEYRIPTKSLEKALKKEEQEEIKLQ